MFSVVLQNQLKRFTVKLISNYNSLLEPKVTNLITFLLIYLSLGTCNFDFSQFERRLTYFKLKQKLGPFRLLEFENH